MNIFIQSSQVLSTRRTLFTVMAAPTQLSSFGGLKVRNDSGISHALFCELCHFLLLIPVQLLCCGTRLCLWCAQQGLSDR